MVIALIRDEEGKILLAKRVDALNPSANGKWEFPGGVVEFGESPREALLRECQEEIGCTIEIVRLLPHLHEKIWERTDYEIVQVFVSCFEARIIEGKPKPAENEISEIRWWKREEIAALDSLPGTNEFVSLLGRQKRQVVSFIPYLMGKGEPLLYLQRKTEDAERLPGFLCFFGGGIEENETPEQALVREIREELDIVLEECAFFDRYEHFSAVQTVFTKQVDDNFEKSVKVLEGEYGKFFTKKEIFKEPKILEEEKLIIRDFYKLHEQ